MAGRLLHTCQGEPLNIWTLSDECRRPGTSPETTETATVTASATEHPSSVLQEPKGCENSSNIRKKECGANDDIECPSVISFSGNFEMKWKKVVSILLDNLYNGCRLIL